MKNPIKTRTFFICISLLFLLVSAERASAQAFYINPGDSVNVFGPAQKIVVAGQTLKIRSKLIRHFGTTCQYEIEITNQGTQYLLARTGMVSVRKDEINVNNSVNVELKPNYYAIYKMEIRECFKKGVKNPMISCNACNPRIGFYNPTVR